MIRTPALADSAHRKSHVFRILRVVMLIPLGWVIGILLLWLVYAIPGDAIFVNAVNSIAVFEREGSYPMLVEDDNTTKMDNFTDAWMLNIAANREAEIHSSPFERAIQQYWTRPVGQNSFSTAINNTYFSGISQSNELVSYGRYWGGFVIPLRVAMLKLSYAEIRILNGIFQALLLNALLYMVWKKLGLRRCAAVIVAWLALEPIVIIFSLQYSTCYYLGFGGALYLVAVYGGESRLSSDPIFAFTLLGMLTSYLDFLTYPIFTLGFPLLMYLAGTDRDWKEKLRLLFLLSALWSLGYLGMWAGKLLVAWIAGYPGIAQSAISAFLVRSSLDGAEPINRLSVILANIHVYTRKMLLLMLLPSLIVFLYYTVKAFHNGRFTPLNAIPYLLIALLPLGWYLVVSEHSFVHSWYTHRNLAVSFTSICLIASDVWRIQVTDHSDARLTSVH